MLAITSFIKAINYNMDNYSLGTENSYTKFSQLMNAKTLSHAEFTLIAPATTTTLLCAKW